MQIVLALVIGAALGFAAEFAVPGRDARGIAIAPVLGAVVSAAAWAGLTWAGVGIDTVWIWLAAVAAPAIVVAPALAVLTRLRASHDAAERQRLRIS